MDCDTGRTRWAFPGTKREGKRDQKRICGQIGKVFGFPGTCGAGIRGPWCCMPSWVMACLTGIPSMASEGKLWDRLRAFCGPANGPLCNRWDSGGPISGPLMVRPERVGQMWVLCETREWTIFCMVGQRKPHIGASSGPHAVDGTYTGTSSAPYRVPCGTRKRTRDRKRPVFVPRSGPFRGFGTVKAPEVDYVHIRVFVGAFRGPGSGPRDSMGPTEGLSKAHGGTHGWTIAGSGTTKDPCGDPEVDRPVSGGASRGFLPGLLWGRFGSLFCPTSGPCIRLAHPLSRRAFRASCGRAFPPWSSCGAFIGPCPGPWFFIYSLPFTGRGRPWVRGWVFPMWGRSCPMPSRRIGKKKGRGQTAPSLGFAFSSCDVRTGVLHQGRRPSAGGVRVLCEGRHRLPPWPLRRISTAQYARMLSRRKAFG